MARRNAEPARTVDPCSASLTKISDRGVGLDALSGSGNKRRSMVNSRQTTGNTSRSALCKVSTFTGSPTCSCGTGVDDKLDGELFKSRGGVFWVSWTRFQGQPHKQIAPFHRQRDWKKRAVFYGEIWRQLGFDFPWQVDVFAR